MKKYLAVLFVSAMVLFTSCEKNRIPSDDGVPVNEAVLASFNQKYPGAINVEWENKAPYWVATFDMPVKSRDGQNSAWFDNQGNWKMTEHDILFDQLPQAVKDSFASSEYATWVVDEVEVLERDNVVELYVLEVEQESAGVEKEAELYYSADGVLVKVMLETDVDDDYSDMITADPEVVNVVKGLYPDAQVADVDFEDNMYEVDIIDGGRKKEVVLDASKNWLFTETELELHEVPEVVMNAYRASEYSSYELDDAKLIETPSGKHYILELEKGDKEVDLKIAEDGTIMK